MDTATRIRWLEANAELITSSHLAQPDQLAVHLADALEPLGVDVTVYLVDREQRALRALPARRPTADGPIPVDTSLPGRVFAMGRPLPPADAPPASRFWSPMVNGTERLGVVEFVLPDHLRTDDTDVREQCQLIAGLVGHLVTSKFPYGDGLRKLRRSHPMTVGAELLWQILPPLTFSCERLTISAILEPCYEVGGDGFDYAVDGSIANITILDAAGRGLRAGLACAVALAAIRATRRAGGALDDQARAADAAIMEQFPDARFATAVLATLDLDSGRLHYINAGHPAPLLLREGKLVRTLEGGRRMPLGLEDPSTAAAEEMLEPGDRLLLYTDGVTDRRAPDGEEFGFQRLLRLVERELADRLPTPETLRRLCHAVIARQGTPDDDATLLLLDWSSSAAHRNVP